MRTSDDIVERIRNATSIVDVVSEHVRLRKRGRNHIGLCPFHTEKTPSFNVLEDKGIYKCFGCGEAGDVFSFVMKIEGLTFPETLAKLAKNAGIDYTPHERKFDQEKEDKTEPLINACRDFAAFCYRTLRSDSGIMAMKYLLDRDFTEEILKKFGVGFAPDGNASFLRSQNGSKRIQVYEQAGIISKNERGEYYDRFRNRVIFPVMNPTGRIIGFGGRILPGANKELAKYVNSPETPIYHKSHVLFGLFQAKDSIRKNDFAILVEGYADVLTLSQFGFENTVAASGTSLTLGQLDILRRYTKTIILLFDADFAGNNAAIRGIELAIESDFDVSLVVLPSNEDPDTYLHKYGDQSFTELLNKRKSFIELKAEKFKEQGWFKTAEGQSRAIRSLIETIAKSPHESSRRTLARIVGEKFGIPLDSIIPELQRVVLRKKREEIRGKVQREEKEDDLILQNAFLNAQNHQETVSTAEKVLLRAFLENTRVAYKAVIDLDFDISLIENEYVTSVIITCIRSYEENGEAPSVAILLEAFREDEDVRKLMIDTSIGSEKVSDEWDNAQYSQSEIEEKIAQSARQSADTIMKNSYKKEQKAIRPDLNSLSDDDELKLILEKAQAAAQMIHAKD